MAILSSGLTAEEARVLIAAITSTPMIIGGISAFLVNLGTLIVVIRGRQKVSDVKTELAKVKEIVNHRTGQLLEAMEFKGRAAGIEQGIATATELEREARRDAVELLKTDPPPKGGKK